MPFQPGMSGNPGERPKVVAEVRDLARQYSSIAIEALVEIAQSGKHESARVSAATALLDCGWGRPTQPVAGGPEMGPIGMTIEEQRAAALKAIDEAFAEPDANARAA